MEGCSRLFLGNIYFFYLHLGKMALLIPKGRLQIFCFAILFYFVFGFSQHEGVNHVFIAVVHHSPAVDCE